MGLKTWCNEFFDHESKYYLNFILYISAIMIFIEGCILILQTLSPDIIHGDPFMAIFFIWFIFGVLTFSYYSMIRDQENYNKRLEKAIKEISEVVKDDLKTCKIEAIIRDRL